MGGEGGALEGGAAAQGKRSRDGEFFEGFRNLAFVLFEAEFLRLFAGREGLGRELRAEI